MLILGCSSEPRKKNFLELELDKIQKGSAKIELEKLSFSNFDIDWKNPTKWESSCEYYKVIPNRDTFDNTYYLDFCNDEFRWWDRGVK